MQTSHSSIFSSFIRMSQVSMVMLYSSEIKKYFCLYRGEDDTYAKRYFKTTR